MAFNVDDSIPLKIKRPAIEQPFMNEEGLVVQQDNYFLKPFNLKKALRECNVWDINNSNIYKFLAEGMKIEEKQLRDMNNKSINDRENNYM